MIKAWIVLLYATIIIKFRSLEQISLMLKKRKTKCIETWTYDEVDSTLNQVESAKKLFLFRVACLEQSLTIFLLATSNKKSVDLCVGIRLAPFVSHAWIEVNGIPVREPDAIETYKKILVI
jgi:hypothetical protein